MKILILGESGGRPWRAGKSAEKLRRWFGVNSYDELARLATLMNVYTVRATEETSREHFAELRAAIVESDVVFLVGRVAQEEVFVRCEKLSQVYWVQNKYVGLPHPSGLNRQLNYFDETILVDLIKNKLGVKE